MSSDFVALSHTLGSIGPALANHLWQSTAFAAAVWLLTLALRSNQARVRHAVWLAASIKFLVPFSLLIAAGNLLPHPKQPVAPAVYSAMDVVEEPFAEIALPPAAPVIHTPTMRERLEAVLPATLAAIWLVGAGVVLVVWASRWRVVRRALREAEPASEGRELEILRRLEERFAGGRRARTLPLRLSAERMEPGIIGVFQPALLWPEELSARLDDEHIEAIIAHELAHVRRRDNLTAALHMLVETAFWFHPAVWWMERQMVKEREQACDEAVVEMGGDAQNFAEVYAESLLKTCRFCIESPLACVAGVTGADLKQRVVGIVTGRALLRMSWPKKLLLAGAAVCVIAAPIVLGQAKSAQRLMLAAINAAPRPLQTAAHAMMADASSTNAAADAPPASVPGSASDPCSTTQGAKFDVVSIKPSKASSGDWDSETNADGVSLSGTTKALIQEAFGLRDFQVIGGPDWIAFDTFDIKAKFDVPEKPGDQAGSKAAALRWTQRYRSLLQEQFQFRCHMATKELPVYDLVVAKGGAKLKTASVDSNGESTDGHGDAHKIQVIGTGVGMEHMVGMLARYSGRTVVDKTGLTGKYDFVLNWSTERQAEQSAQDGEPSLPELPTALEEQLGLKLVPSKGPVPVLVIDHIEKPAVDGAEVQQSAAASVIPAAMAQEKAGAVSANDASQSAAYVPTMTFDVASVRESKPDPSGWTRVSGGFEPADSSHWRVENNDLHGLLGQAYDVNYNLIEGIPRSMGYATTFNVDAKGDVATDEKLAKLDKKDRKLEQQHMIQVLLADRFHMKAHWETRDGPTYDLVVSKRGRLVSTGAPPSAEELKNFGSRPIPPLYQKGDSGRGFEFIAHGATTANIVPMLAGQFGRPVSDKTGLTDKYDFDLKYYQTRASDRKDDETNPWAPLETAIQDQLGLKLVSTHGPVRYLVIDNVEMPTEN